MTSSERELLELIAKWRGQEEDAGPNEDYDAGIERGYGRAADELEKLLAAAPAPTPAPPTILYESATSGLRYANPLAAGDISAVVVDGKVYRLVPAELVVPEREPHGDYIHVEAAARRGLFKWREKPHNAKWWKRIDGTPIPNDLIVCVAEETTRQVELVREDATLAEHKSHVEFEQELYATLVDPVAEGSIKEAEMRKQLLESARWYRQHAHDLETQLNALAAAPRAAGGQRPSNQSVHRLAQRFAKQITEFPNELREWQEVRWGTPRFETVVNWFERELNAALAAAEPQVADGNLKRHLEATERRKRTIEREEPQV